MINIATETPKLLSALRAHPLLVGRTGRPVSAATIWRYCAIGVGANRTKLETISMPYGTCSTDRAVERFIQQLNQQPAGELATA
jgi:hypothetical protein